MSSLMGAFTVLLHLIVMVAAKSTAFNITLARRALDFAAAVYADDPRPCLRQHNASLVLQVEIPCDALRDKCWAIIANTDDLLVVSFQGTASKFQLITELLETMTAPKQKVDCGGSVQRYFDVALESIAIPLALKLNKLRATFPEKKLLFTGHSLGGALASLAAARYTFNMSIPADQVFLYTFGQPRVGNFEYAQAVDRLVPNTFRLVHRFDLVSHIPYCIGLFSCSQGFNHSPYHHGTEIWFPDDMSKNAIYRVCNGTPVDEDNTCSDNYYVRYNIDDHLHYFNREVSDYGSAGCPPDNTYKQYMKMKRLHKHKKLINNQLN